MDVEPTNKKKPPRSHNSDLLSDRLTPVLAELSESAKPDEQKPWHARWSCRCWVLTAVALFGLVCAFTTFNAIGIKMQGYAMFGATSLISIIGVGCAIVAIRQPEVVDGEPKRTSGIAGLIANLTIIAVAVVLMVVIGNLEELRRHAADQQLKQEDPEAYRKMMSLRKYGEDVRKYGVPSQKSERRNVRPSVEELKVNPYAGVVEVVDELIPATERVGNGVTTTHLAGSNWLDADYHPQRSRLYALTGEALLEIDPHEWRIVRKVAVASPVKLHLTSAGPCVQARRGLIFFDYDLNYAWVHEGDEFSDVQIKSHYLLHYLFASDLFRGVLSSDVKIVRANEQIGRSSVSAITAVDVARRQRISGVSSFHDVSLFQVNPEAPLRIRYIFNDGQVMEEMLSDGRISGVPPAMLRYARTIDTLHSINDVLFFTRRASGDGRSEVELYSRIVGEKPLAHFQCESMTLPSFWASSDSRWVLCRLDTETLQLLDLHSERFVAIPFSGDEHRGTYTDQVAVVDDQFLLANPSGHSGQAIVIGGLPELPSGHPLPK